MTHLSALSAPLSAPCCTPPPYTPRGADSRSALLRGIGGRELAMDRTGCCMANGTSAPRPCERRAKGHAVGGSITRGFVRIVPILLETVVFLTGLFPSASFAGTV